MKWNLLYFFNVQCILLRLSFVVAKLWKLGVLVLMQYIAKAKDKSFTPD